MGVLNMHGYRIIDTLTDEVVAHASNRIMARRDAKALDEFHRAPGRFDVEPIEAPDFYADLSRGLCF